MKTSDFQPALIDVSNGDHEQWMMKQASTEKMYRFKRREAKSSESIKTDLLYVLSHMDEGPLFHCHMDEGPLFHLDDVITMPNHNFSLVFDNLDEALEYVNNYKEHSPDQLRFVIVLQQGEHKLIKKEGRISRPFTTVISENTAFPEKTIIRANDISGQIFFVDGTHNITVKGMTLTGGNFVNLMDSHVNVPKPCGSGT